MRRNLIDPSLSSHERQLVLKLLQRLNIQTTQIHDEINGRTDADEQDKEMVANVVNRIKERHPFDKRQLCLKLLC